MKHLPSAIIGVAALFGFAAAALGAPAPATTPQDACQGSDFPDVHYTGNDCGVLHPLDQISFLKNIGVTVEGWLSGGATFNPDTPNTRFSGPVGFADKSGLQLNQGYLSIARTAPANNQGAFLGARVDALYGSDYFFLTTPGIDASHQTGNPLWGNPGFTYGIAIPQAYVTFDWNDLDIKAGHFYSPMTAESSMAKDNFFNTHSYAFLFGEPRTNTGLLLQKPLLPGWTGRIGVVGPWNTYTESDGTSGASFDNLLVGLDYTTQRYALALHASIGHDSDFNIPNIQPYSTRRLVTASGAVNLNPRLNYGIDLVYGDQQNTLGFNALSTERARWYGINQHLIYTINDKWSAGGRLEWFDDPQGYLVTGQRANNPDGRFRAPGSYYETSLGLNYKPHPNLTLRGEARADWHHGAGYSSPNVIAAPPNDMFDDTTKEHQYLLGLNAIVQF